MTAGIEKGSGGFGSGAKGIECCLSCLGYRVQALRLGQWSSQNTISCVVDYSELHEASTTEEEDELGPAPRHYPSMLLLGVILRALYSDQVYYITKKFPTDNECG